MFPENFPKSWGSAMAPDCVAGPGTGQLPNLRQLTGISSASPLTGHASELKGEESSMGSVVTTRLQVLPGRSLGARYESLIRLAESIRAQPEPAALFRVLVNELSEVIPFDAIAQYDESS